MASIFGQTSSSWELIVVDNYSDDGAWEFFQDVARKDNRVRISQAPREGLYVNWNNCIRQATGRYVYIAANDDIMATDFLEKQAAALEQHPGCGLAHCELRVIDEEGSEIPDWWLGSTFARSSGQLLHHPHVRRAPFDGLLHLLGDSVYTSLSQLLIRRSLFSRIGYFESRWDSVGDFNWNMRAGLVTDTVHVPETWGGWRRHSDQATVSATLGLPKHRRMIDEMIEHAIQNTEAFLAPQIRKALRSRWANRTRDLREFDPAIRMRRERFPQRAFLAKRLLCGSWAARHHIGSQLFGWPRLPEAGPELIQRWLERARGDSVLVPV